jgi:hypothetical protein
MPQQHSGSALPPATRARLENLHHALLRLHKILLDDERSAYEREHGRTSAGDMLQLVLSHEQFAWLRTISELIVRTDELLELDEPLTADDVAVFIARTRSLLLGTDAGTEFGRKYLDALQRQPDAVFAHKEASRILSDGG